MGVGLHGKTLFNVTKTEGFVTLYVFDKMYRDVAGPWGSLFKSSIKRGPQPSATAPEL